MFSKIYFLFLFFQIYLFIFIKKIFLNFILFLNFT